MGICEETGEGNVCCVLIVWKSARYISFLGGWEYAEGLIDRIQGLYGLID